MACVKRRRNRWVVDFRDQDGKRRWQTYSTRDEADTALSKLVPAVKQGTYRPPAELPDVGDGGARLVRHQGRASGQQPSRVASPSRRCISCQRSGSAALTKSAWPTWTPSAMPGARRAWHRRPSTSS